MFHVSVTDDHDLIRMGIRNIFENHNQISVKGEFRTAQELFDSLESTQYDLHIIDLNMPEISGIEAIKYLKENNPGVKIVVLSMYPQTLLGNLALSAGANAYLQKVEPAEKVVATVEKLLLCPKEECDEPSAFVAESETSKLSKREIEVLKLTSQGNTNSHIAKKLNISPKTVNTYRARVREKLKIATTRELYIHCIDKDLVNILQHHMDIQST